MTQRLPRKISDRFGTQITFQTLFGPWPTVDDLRTRLQTLRRTDVINRIAWCSAFAKTWETAKNNASDRVLRDYLFPFWREHFHRWTDRYGDGFFFTRHTMLWLLRQALRYCDPNGRPLAPDNIVIFGEAILISNDLAAFLEPKPLPTDLAIAANMLPNMEYFSHEDYDRDIGRMLYLLTDLAPNAVGTPFPALAARLQQLLGYDVTEYCDLAMACAMDTSAFLVPNLLVPYTAHCASCAYPLRTAHEPPASGIRGSALHCATYRDLSREVSIRALSPWLRFDALY